MKQLFITYICASFLLITNLSHAAPLSADDFLPPVAAGSPEAEKAASAVQDPAAVKEETGIGGEKAVAASSAQDAVNAVIERVDVGGGCEQIKFPSGFGWVATGVAVYNVTQNPVANLTLQRQVYQIAFLNAKKNLAAALNGLSTQGKEELNQQFKTVLTDTDTLSNLSETFRENITEQINGLLRGYVVYSVKDDQADGHGTVTVAIVVTPKTLGKGQRVGAEGLSADSVKDGLNAVLTELSAGLAPPVGGKVISVPHTGELAFVGFGSAVVPANPNTAAQAKLVLNAQKTAQMRARSSLCGIILGDDVSATSSLDAGTKTISDQFAEAQKDDPTATAGAEVQKLESQREGFVSAQLNKEQITSLKNGVLPPGVTIKTFMNPEKTIAEAVAVYMPSVSANAAAAGKEMKNSRQVQQPGATDGASGQGVMPPQGPTGQIMHDSDL